MVNPASMVLAFWTITEPKRSSLLSPTEQGYMHNR